MLKELRKAMDNPIQNIRGVVCFVDDIKIVSKGSLPKHKSTVHSVPSKLDKGGFETVSWLGSILTMRLQTKIFYSAGSPRSEITWNPK